MALIEQAKSNIDSLNLPLVVDKFTGNILSPSDTNTQVALDTIETLNLADFISMDSITPTTLTVSNAVLTQPVNGLITVSVSTDRKLEVSFTGNFTWSAALANPGELQILIDGPMQVSKIFEIPYLASSLSQTICFEFMSPYLDAGIYDVSILIRNTDNTGATLTLNADGELFAIEKSEERIPRTLTGVVSDYLANPIENATVAYGANTTLTNVLGEYTLSNLPNFGAVEIEVTESNYNTSSSYVNLRNGDGVKNFTLTGFTISGQITGYRNRPLMDSSVSVMALSPSLSSNGDVYLLENLYPGTFDLEFTDSNHISNIHQLTITNTNLIVNKNLLPNELNGVLTSSITGEGAGNLKFTVGGKLEITGNIGEYEVKDIPAGPIDFTTLDDPRFESDTDSVSINMGTNVFNKTVVPKTIPLGVKGLSSPPFNTLVNRVYANRFTANVDMLFMGWRIAFITNTQQYLTVRLRLWNSAGILLTSTSNYYMQEPVNSINGYLKDILAPSSINLVAGQEYSVGIYLETNVGSLTPILKEGNPVGNYYSTYPYLRKEVTFQSPSYFATSDIFPVTQVPNGGIVYVDPLVKL